jgi:MYXO-CTERM domain-containing protein
MRWHGGIVWLAGFLCVGCAVEAEPGGERGRVERPIINGVVDTTHTAVVGVFNGVEVCSGTIIAVDGSDGYVLTTASCVATNAATMILEGDDYTSPGTTYSVAEQTSHPSASGGDFDFAVIRFTGATASTPVIPAMTPAEDNLTTSDTVTAVGYGITSFPAGANTTRRSLDLSIASLTSTVITVPLSSGGPCTGDGGGPLLSQGTERVAGVNSFSDGTCSTAAGAGRVSAVYDDFIAPNIGVDGADAGPGSPDAGADVPDAGFAEDDAMGAQPDAGGGDGGDDGCGCRGQSGSPGVALFLVALFLVARRRRASLD